MSSLQAFAIDNSVHFVHKRLGYPEHSPSQQWRPPQHRPHMVLHLDQINIQLYLYDIVMKIKAKTKKQEQYMMFVFLPNRYNYYLYIVYLIFQCIIQALISTWSTDWYRAPVTRDTFYKLFPLATTKYRGLWPQNGFYVSSQML